MWRRCSRLLSTFHSSSLSLTKSNLSSSSSSSSSSKIDVSVISSRYISEAQRYLGSGFDTILRVLSMRPNESGVGSDMVSSPVGTESEVGTKSSAPGGKEDGGTSKHVPDPQSGEEKRENSANVGGLTSPSSLRDWMSRWLFERSSVSTRARWDLLWDRVQSSTRFTDGSIAAYRELFSFLVNAVGELESLNDFLDRIVWLRVLSIVRQSRRNTLDRLSFRSKPTKKELSELQWHLEHSIAVYDDGRGPIGELLQWQRSSGANRPKFFVTQESEGLQTGESQRILLSIRGTQGLGDILSDMRCAGHRPLEKVHVSKNVWVHEGLWACALFVLQQIESEEWFTRLRNSPDATFYITGHSLGAGTAALLTYMLSHEPSFQANVRCYGFATPPCCSESVADFLSDKMTTVVCGDDIIPRLSLYTVDTFIKDFRRVDSELTTLFYEYGVSRWKKISLDSLLVPGRIIHLQRKRSRRTGAIPPKTSASLQAEEVKETENLAEKSSKAGLDREWIARYMHPEELLRFFVSINMATDHMVGAYRTGIRECIASLRNQEL